MPPPEFVWAIDRIAHLVSKGYSILQSMSEEFVGLDRIEDYLTLHYLDEMDFGLAAPIGIRLLGLVLNQVKGILYLFYVFEVALADEVPIKLVVDIEDVLVVKPLDADLLEKVSRNRADVATIVDLLGWKPPLPVIAAIDRGDLRAIARGYPGAYLPEGMPRRMTFDPALLPYADIDAWATRPASIRKVLAALRGVAVKKRPTSPRRSRS